MKMIYKWTFTSNDQKRQLKRFYSNSYPITSVMAILQKEPSNDLITWFTDKFRESKVDDFDVDYEIIYVDRGL